MQIHICVHCIEYADSQTDFLHFAPVWFLCVYFTSFQFFPLLSLSFIALSPALLYVSVTEKYIFFSKKGHQQGDGWI